jgi:hypothetical protein
LQQLIDRSVAMALNFHDARGRKSSLETKRLLLGPLTGRQIAMLAGQEGRTCCRPTSKGPTIMRRAAQEQGEISSIDQFNGAAPYRSVNAAGLFSRRYAIACW